MPLEKAHVELSGSEHAPVTGAIKGEPVADDVSIRVSVLVRRRTVPADAVQSTIGRERPHLTRAEFRDAFGADPTELEKVASVLREFGLRTIESDVDRRTVVLEGSAGEMSAAFKIRLTRYSGSGANYRGYEGSVHVPGDISDIVEGVFGLDDRPQAKPHFRVAGSISGKASSAHVAANGISGVDIAKAYMFPPSTGAGQTIGIIEFGGGFLTTDVTSYFASLNIAPPTVTVVSVDLATNSPGASVDLEVALDIQVAGTCAPGAKIVVYFAPNTDAGWLDAISTAVNDATNNPGILSISWGNPEEMWAAMTRSALDSAFADAAAMGITVCVASGDDGASDMSFPAMPDELAHVDFPASSPHALACGGTRLDLAASPPTEAVWNGHGASGGGISSVFAVPTYQMALSMPSAVNPGAGAGRGVPDVAGNADPGTGYLVHLDGMDQNGVGGTSAVAPLWAGLIARLNESLGGQIGFIHPTLYRLIGSGCFTDITAGNNDVGHDNGGYTAAAGWDACTGLGTPIGTALLTALTASRLSQFFAPNQITCGYSQTSLVFIDKPDTVPVDIQLNSDDKTVVSVPSIVPISVGATSATVTFTTAAISGSFPPKFVSVHADYAGKRLTISVEIVPPRVVSLTLSPSVVTAGQKAKATVTLDRPSLNGDVVVDLLNGAPGFATFSTTKLTIAQGHSSADFQVRTTAISTPFPTAQVSILAVYKSAAANDPGTSAMAVLTVKSKAVAGILASLTLSPATVTGGLHSRGTVTLTQAVPTPTVVGLAALDPFAVGGSQLPLPGNQSTIASVPPAITIPAGQTSGQFTITTSPIGPGHLRKAQILAAAVMTRMATLTITP